MIPAPNDRHSLRSIERKHPDYDDLALRYQLLRDAFTSTGGFESYRGAFDAHSGARKKTLPNITYLQKYQSESTVNWHRRIEGAYYPNWIKRIVGIYSGLLIREESSPLAYPEALLEWQNRYDWPVKRAKIVPWALVYPRLYLVVSRPPRPEAVSAAQVPDDDMSYVRMIHPDRVLDWSEDETGELEWIKYETDLDISLPGEGDLGPLGEHQRGRKVWCLTREGWWYYHVWTKGKTADVPVIDSGKWDDSLAGTVPVAVYRSGLSQDDLPDEAPIEQLVNVMRRLYNVLSQKASIEDLSCFPKAQIPIRTKSELAETKWGPSELIGYPAENSRGVEYVGYDVAPVKHMTDEAERLTVLLKDLASVAIDQDGGNTGIARAYAFMLTDATLADFQGALSRLERDTMDLVSRQEGAGPLPDEADPGLPMKYDLVTAREAIEASDVLLKQNLPPAAETEVKRVALNTYLNNLPADRAKTIEEQFMEAEEEAIKRAKEPPPPPPPDPGADGEIEGEQLPPVPDVQAR